MRQLILNRAVLETAKAGGTVRVPHGTSVKEVSSLQLEEECAVYSEAGVDELGRVERRLKEVRRRYSKGGAAGISRGRGAKRSMLLNEILDRVNLLLTDEPGVQ